jgi:hypothetical protein
MHSLQRLSLSVLFALSLQTYAQVNTITDTTTGTATVDGTINVGEYVGSAGGINSGFGDVIGTGSLLYIDSDTSGNLNFGLASGGRSVGEHGVIYIDSIAGGFTSTTNFTDGTVGNDNLRQAISGKTATSDATLTFAPGFEADYAIGFLNGFVALWELQENSFHIFEKTLNSSFASAQTAEFELTLADIGLTANAGDSFDYFVTYMNAQDAGNDNIFRSDEWIGVDSFPGVSPGTNPVTLSAGDYNTFVSIPEPSTALMMLTGFAAVLFSMRRRRR